MSERLFINTKATGKTPQCSLSGNNRVLHECKNTRISVAAVPSTTAVITITSIIIAGCAPLRRGGAEAVTYYDDDDPAGF